jgi:MBOAT, membrane-bound O-acyltransferase family
MRPELSSFLRASDSEAIPARVPEAAVVAGLAVAAVAAAAALGPLIGMTWPPAALVLLGVGAVLVQADPARALPIAVACGVAALASINPTYAAYHVVIVAALFATRRSTPAFALTLVTLALVVPKELFRRHYHQPGFYNWLNEPSLGAAVLVACNWWRTRREQRLPSLAGAPELPSWACLYFFPTHAINPLLLRPADLWRDRRVDRARVLQSVVLLGAKALAHASLQRVFPGFWYSELGSAQIAALDRAHLWLVVALNYVDLALVLSGTADVVVLFARLYGWPLASPFRWALLAWNPVELWRRWNVYNRRFLLENVYFPLGGARHRMRNVMLTFLASALVLHTGWVGSKYWQVGPAGLRDQVTYFALQGLAVCACLGWWRATGKDQRADRALRWSWGRAVGTLATQSASALAHVIVLAHQLPFAERWHVVGRCLGRH